MMPAETCRFRWHLLAWILVALALCAGCGEKSLSDSKKRAITNEIVSAARKSAEAPSEVAVRSGIDSFDDILRGQPSVDNIYVTVPDSLKAIEFRRSLAEITRRNRM